MSRSSWISDDVPLTSKKKVSSLDKSKRPTSVVTTSEKVRNDLNNIITSFNRTNSDDPVTEFTQSQDTSVHNVPIITFEVKDFENFDHNSEDNEDSTLNSIPSAKPKFNGSDDDSSIDSDESNSFYFQNDKTHISEWIEDNDEHNINNKTNSNDELKPSTIDHDDIKHVNTNTHNNVGKNTIPSDVVFQVATSNDVVHSKNTVPSDIVLKAALSKDVVHNNIDNNVIIIKTVDMKHSYNKSITNNMVLQSTDPDIHKILAPVRQAFQELTPEKTSRTLKIIEYLIISCQSDSISIDELQIWIHSSKTSIRKSMIKANNIKTDIIKGNFESKILLTSVNSTIPHGNLDIQVLYCTRDSILNSEYRIDHTRKLVTVLNNKSKEMIENISTYITNYKVEHDT